MAVYGATKAFVLSFSEALLVWKSPVQVDKVSVASVYYSYLIESEL